MQVLLHTEDWHNPQLQGAVIRGGSQFAAGVNKVCKCYYILGLGTTHKCRVL